MRKLTTVLLALFMIATPLSVIAGLSAGAGPEGPVPLGGGSFGGGDGSAGNPYNITDVLDLQAMNTTLWANFTLANDIDASETSGWNEDSGIFRGFMPVGNWTHRFTGSLDGRNYTITGLYINRPTYYNGLFGYVDGGEVRNVGVVDADVSGDRYVGGLVGRNSGVIENSYATGTMSGTFYVGGLVGDNYFGTVNNTYATGTITRKTSSEDTDFGGFVGRNYQGKIINCYSTGSVHYEGVADPTSKGFCGGVNTGGDYEMTGNYWDTDTSLQTITAGEATGKTTAEMKTQATFIGWDFTNIWFIVEGVTYPTLLWQDSEDPVVNAGPDQTVDEGVVVDFDGSASTDDFGIANYTWTFEDDGAKTLYGVDPEYVFNTPGVYNVTLKVTDFAGNWDIDWVEITVIDITPPVITLNSPAINSIIPAGTILDFSVTDLFLNIVNYSVNGGVNISFPEPYDIDTTVWVDGTYIIEVHANDTAGNTAVESYTFTIDSTAPVADAGPDQTVDEDTLVTFDGSGSTDNTGIDNYTWTFDDSGQQTLYGIGPTYTFNTPGVYNVTLNVTDAAGNWDIDWAEITVIDITPPVITLNSPANNSIIPVGTILDFSVTDLSLNVVNYSVNGGANISFLEPYNIDTTGWADGTYIIEVHANDTAGNTAVESYTFTIDSTAPVADAGPDQTVDENTVVTFNGSDSTDNVGIVNYTWTFDDGGQQTLYDVDPTYTFNTPGVYNVTLNVTDAVGNWDLDWVEITVNDVTDPIASAGPDQTVDEDTVVTFDGSGSTDNIGIVNYTWTFTDGETQTIYGVNPTYTFNTPGVFVVTLNITDAADNWDTDTMTVIVRHGNGTISNPYIIYNVYDLQNMSANLSAHYVLANDINASATKTWNSDRGFVPIANDTDSGTSGFQGTPFTGSLNGQGYNITGLFINRLSPNPKEDFVGLFGYLGDSANVSDISLINFEVSGRDFVGSIAGLNGGGTIIGCSVEGDITGDYSGGGLVGLNRGHISNCSSRGNTLDYAYGSRNMGSLVGWNGNTGTIMNSYSEESTCSGTRNVGGLVGLNSGTINNSYSTGSASGYDDIGGLVGKNTGTVSDCYATGSVYGDTDVGGLVGENSGQVTDSYATGDVIGYEGVGGLIGYNLGNASNTYATGNVIGEWYDVGGLIGYNTGTVQRSYASGEVTGDYDYIGGLIGYNDWGDVSDSYASGNVIGTGDNIEWDNSYYVGGLVGYNDKGTITNCYSTGSVDGDWVGGLVSGNTGTVTNSFWDMDTSGLDYSDGGTGKNTTEMMDLTTFANAGWDIAHIQGHLGEIWYIDDGLDYPRLWWTYTDTYPPTAEAGGDQTVGMGTIVTFNGSASTDNVRIANYTWTFNDGGTVTLYDVAPTYQFDNAGVFVVTLNVTDTSGNWDTDTMTVTVDSEPPVAVIVADPDSPVGQNTMVVFSGNTSTDNVGVTGYTWFLDGVQVSTDSWFGFTFIDAGTYEIALNVTDLVGNTHNTSITYTVNDTENPVANAGPYQVVDEGTLVTFNGSASTDNVGIDNYTWTFYDGTGDITLYEASPSHIFSVPGIYVVTLNVMDAAGNSHTDTMNVTVNDITNPAADAGPDRNVTAGTLVTFDGSGSTDNVGVDNYTWTFSHNGTAVTLYGASPSFRFWEAGNHTVTLTVKDAAGNAGTDTILVRVNPVVEDDDDDEPGDDDDPTDPDDDDPADPGDDDDDDPVTVPIIIGPVLDADGDPVSGADVVITIDGVNYTGTTDATGYAIVNVPESAQGGPITVDITKEGYDPINYDTTLGADGTPATQPTAMDEAAPEPEEKGGIGDYMWIIIIIVIVAVIGLVALMMMGKGKAPAGAPEEPVPEDAEAMPGEAEPAPEEVIDEPAGEEIPPEE